MTDFRTWSHESLARFAEDQTKRNRELEEALEDAERDRRDALVELRKVLAENA